MPEEKLDELLLAWEEAQETGKPISTEDLCRDCPELADELRKRIDSLRSMDWLTKPTTNLRGYKLVKLIGRGGFGQVWAATAPDGRAVAVKFVQSAGRVDASFAFEHPHLLRTFETWEADGFQVLAMELAERSLHDRLRELHAVKVAGIPKDELLGFFRQAADALDFLHSKGVYHRDIKPHNLLLVGNTLKVADFGLAKLSQHTTTGHTGTMTAAYAAPEFFQEKTHRNSDQYSLAITYCQLRGGKLPFDGPPESVMLGHLRQESDLSMIPPEERPAVARAMSKRPEGRWPDCKTFVEAIAGPVYPRRRRGILAAAMGVLLLTGALALSFAFKSDKQESVPPSQPGPQPRATEPAKPQLVFVFDGKSRIITQMDRFAPVTLEAWVKPGVPTAGYVEKYLVGSDIPGKSGIGLALSYNKGLNRAPDMEAQLLPSPSKKGFIGYEPVPLGKWSHVAAVFGPEGTTLFLDGKIVEKGPPTANRGGTPFVVGNAGKDNPEHYFVKQMRVARISRGERYKQDFIPNPVFTSDEAAVVIYDAAHIKGMTVMDLSGKGNDGWSEGVTVMKQP